MRWPEYAKLANVLSEVSRNWPNLLNGKFIKIKKLKINKNKKIIHDQENRRNSYKWKTITIY